jgi:predicted TIM-barrel enzyme
MGMTRREILEKLRKARADGEPIIGAGIGLGLVAKCAEAGGIDLIVLYNSGRYRMAGRGSMAGLMPYGDANAIAMELASEVIPVVRRTPVLAGVCGTDPFRQMPVLLAELKDMGFAGVQNFPTVGIFDGVIRLNLEETGMGFDREVEMIRLSHELDLLTCPYVFNEDEARAMAEAGADVVVAHVGVTSSGHVGAKTTVTLDDAAARIQSMLGAAKTVRDDVLVLCHGGPVAEPPDVAYVMKRVHGLDGFLGGSSIDRLPAERAITEQVIRFKGIGRGIDQPGHDDSRTALPAEPTSG